MQVIVSHTYRKPAGRVYAATRKKLEKLAEEYGAKVRRAQKTWSGSASLTGASLSWAIVYEGKNFTEVEARVSRWALIPGARRVSIKFQPNMYRRNRAVLTREEFGYWTINKIRFWPEKLTDCPLF